MISIDNKAILTLSGYVVVMPAKPVIVLAAIGVATVCVVGYYLLNDDEDEDKKIK